MRAWFMGLALAAIWSSSAAQVPPGPPRERATVVPPEVITTTSLHPTANPTVWQCHKGGSCPVPIAVTVDITDASGRTCKFAIPSFVITKNKNTEITWNLTESGSSTHAHFADNKGMPNDGIYIYGGADFKGRKRQPQSFSWQRDKNPGSDEALTYFYDVYVENDLGKCDVPDPIIVNMD